MNPAYYTLLNKKNVKSSSVTLVLTNFAPKYV